MKNWKTTLIGIATGLALALPTLISSATTGGKVNWQMVLAGGLVTVGGLVAKDHDVTGGTKQQ